MGYGNINIYLFKIHPAEAQREAYSLFGGGYISVCEATKESIEDSIKKVLEMTEEERGNIIEKAYKRCQEFTWDKMADKYRELFLSFLKKT